MTTGATFQAKWTGAGWDPSITGYGGVFEINLLAPTLALPQAMTAIGGQFMLSTDGTARSLNFTPPSVATRYRFVNVATAMLPGAPITILSTLGTETGSRRVVVHDTLEVMYLPTIGFVTAGGQRHVIGQALTDVLQTETGTPTATLHNLLYEVFLPAGSLRPGDELALSQSLEKSGTTISPSVQGRLRTSAMPSDLEAASLTGAAIFGNTALTAGQRAHFLQDRWAVRDNTTIISASASNQYGLPGSYAAVPTVHTVADLSTTDHWLTITVVRPSNTESMRVKQARWEIFR